MQMLADPRPRGNLERYDQRIADRRARLKAAGQRHDGNSLGAGHLRQLTAGGAYDPPVPEHPGRLEGGERLLGLTGVAAAQNRRVGGDPRRQRVVTRHDDRARRAVPQRGPRQLAADRRAPHAGDHEPSGRVLELQIGRFHPPQCVAKVIGQAEDVAQLPGGVDRGDRVAGELRGGRSPQNLIAPSGNSTPGKIRTPAHRMLPGPIFTPSPSTTPPSMWQRSPIWTPAPRIELLTTVRSPMLTSSSSTELSTWAPPWTVTPRPSTARPPTVAPSHTTQPAATIAGATTRPRPSPPAATSTLSRPSRSPPSVLTLRSRMSKVPCR